MLIKMKSIIVKKIGKRSRGVFAAKNFKKGGFILSIKGKIITKAEMLDSSRYIQDHLGTLGKNKYIIMGYPEKYINHSCSPNIFERNKKIFAMKDIKKGEELCYDYSICSIDDWRMRCRCRSKNCRGIVRGNFFKISQKLQIKYFQYLDDWFLRDFKKECKNLQKACEEKHGSKIYKEKNDESNK